MDLFEAYDHLSAEIALRQPDLPITDNLIRLPSAFPCVAVIPENSRLCLHGGGSDFTGEHSFSVWVLCAYTGSYREARESIYLILQSLVDIPRFFIDEDIAYGEDMVGSQRCVLAKIVGRVA